MPRHIDRERYESAPEISSTVDCLDAGGGGGGRGVRFRARLRRRKKGLFLSTGVIERRNSRFYLNSLRPGAYRRLSYSGASRAPAAVSLLVYRYVRTAGAPRARAHAVRHINVNDLTSIAPWGMRVCMYDGARRVSNNAAWWLCAKRGARIATRSLPKI